MASSGYQSIAYSQSSSPVDSVIQQDRLNGNVLIQQMQQVNIPPPPPPPPLAFNNPMYHFNKESKDQVCPRKARPSSSPCGSLSSSRSVDDIPNTTKNRLGERVFIILSFVLFFSVELQNFFLNFFNHNIYFKVSWL